ncbi:MAG: hypothetical protein ACRDK2_11545, partial [Solirubrobacteraceae bacterium]
MSASSSTSARLLRIRERHHASELGAGLRPRWGLIGVAVLVGSLLAGLAIGPASLSLDSILADIASRVPGLHVGHRLD